MNDLQNYFYKKIFVIKPIARMAYPLTHIDELSGVYPVHRLPPPSPHTPPKKTHWSVMEPDHQEEKTDRRMLSHFSLPLTITFVCCSDNSDRESRTIATDEVGEVA